MYYRDRNNLSIYEDVDSFQKDDSNLYTICAVSEN